MSPATSTSARSGGGGRPEGLRESDLVQLWDDVRLPPEAIQTLAGMPLQVVYRGRRNNGSGPDFLDAIIALPNGVLLHGDVEVHVRASDFRRHGHHRDPAYNRLILHLVFRGDDGQQTRLQNGRLVRVVALERWVSARSSVLQAMLESASGGEPWREPCQSAVERLGVEPVRETLKRLGERRLRAKAAAVARQPPTWAFYQGLLRTLGQGPERPAWLSLAGRLPSQFVERTLSAARAPAVLVLESLFLGAAGLLPAATAGAGPVAGEDQYIASLWQLWRSCGVAASVPISATGPRRPANHPARRLAGLARLLSTGITPLLDRIRRAVLAGEKPEQAMIRLLTVPADGLWQTHLLPWDGSIGSAPPATLIGAAKALELTLNAALPVLLALAEREHDRVLAGAVVAVFHALPAPAPYGRTSHLDRALRSAGAPLIRGSNMSQGALYLFENYCTRGGCGRCPLS